MRIKTAKHEKIPYMSNKNIIVAKTKAAQQFCVARSIVDSKICVGKENKSKINFLTLDQFNNPFITSTTRDETVKLTQDLHRGKMFLYTGPQWSHHHMTTLGQLVVSGLHCSVIMEFQSPERVCDRERERKGQRERERERERLRVC